MERQKTKREQPTEREKNIDGEKHCGGNNSSSCGEKLKTNRWREVTQGQWKKEIKEHCSKPTKLPLPPSRFSSVIYVLCTKLPNN